MYRGGTQEIPKTKVAMNAMQFSAGNWLEDTNKYVRSLHRLSDDGWTKIFDAALEYAGTPDVAMAPISNGEAKNTEELIIDNYSTGDSDAEEADPISDADDESGWNA